MIRAMGPLRSISGRSMERMNGKYKAAIRSRSAMDVNAGNVLLDLAATRFVEKSFGKVLYYPSDIIMLMMLIRT